MTPEEAALHELPKETLVAMIIMMRKKERKLKEQLGFQLPDSFNQILTQQQIKEQQQASPSKTLPPSSKTSRRSSNHKEDRSDNGSSGSGKTREGHASAGKHKSSKEYTATPEKDKGRSKLPTRTMSVDGKVSLKYYQGDKSKAKFFSSRCQLDQVPQHHLKPLGESKHIIMPTVASFTVSTAPVQVPEFDESSVDFLSHLKQTIDDVISESPQSRRIFEITHALTASFFENLRAIHDIAVAAIESGTEFRVVLEKLKQVMEVPIPTIPGKFKKDLMTNALNLIQQTSLNALYVHLVYPISQFLETVPGSFHEVTTNYHKTIDRSEVMYAKYYRKVKTTPDEKLNAFYDNTRSEMQLATQKYVNTLNKILKVHRLDLLLNASVLALDFQSASKVLASKLKVDETAYWNDSIKSIRKERTILKDKVEIPAEVFAQGRVKRNEEMNANPSAISGYLNVSVTSESKKEHIKASTWNRTYFVVENGQLSSYHFVKGNVECNSWNLLTCSMKNSPEKLFGFELIIVCAGGKVDHLFCQSENQESYTQWTTAITNNVMASLANHPDEKMDGADPEAINSRIKLPPKYLQSIQAKNPTCADCGANYPDWTAINLGVVFCIECSGVHRSLGVEYSKCRSLVIDNFDPHTIALLDTLGNDFCNSLLENRLNSHNVEKILPNAPRKQREEFIRSKYIEKLFLISREDANAKFEVGLEKGVAMVDDLNTIFAALLLGENPNKLDNSGLSLLYHALENKKYLIANLLILHGANVNEPLGPMNRTALHFAAANRDSAAIALLVVNGADLTLKDGEGNLPQDLCADVIKEKPFAAAFAGVDSLHALYSEPETSSLPVSFGLVASPRKKPFHTSSSGAEELHGS